MGVDRGAGRRRAARGIRWRKLPGGRCPCGGMADPDSGRVGGGHRGCALAGGTGPLFRPAGDGWDCVGGLW